MNGNNTVSTPEIYQNEHVRKEKIAINGFS